METFYVISSLTLAIISFIVLIFFITVTLRRMIKIGSMRKLNQAVYLVFIESTKLQSIHYIHS